MVTPARQQHSYIPPPHDGQHPRQHQRPPQPAFELQALEPRTLLASVPTITTTATSLGNLLHVVGTSGNDRISIYNTRSGLQLTHSSGWSKLYTGALAQIRIDG